MKNRLRKMMSLVLAVVIAMSAISVNTLAATRMNIANGSNQKLYVDWYSDIIPVAAVHTLLLTLHFTYTSTKEQRFALLQL